MSDAQARLAEMPCPEHVRIEMWDEPLLASIVDLYRETYWNCEGWEEISRWHWIGCCKKKKTCILMKFCSVKPVVPVLGINKCLGPQLLNSRWVTRLFLSYDMMLIECTNLIGENLLRLLVLGDLNIQVLMEGQVHILNSWYPCWSWACQTAAPEHVASMQLICSSLWSRHELLMNYINTFLLL